MTMRARFLLLLLIALAATACGPREVVMPRVGLDAPSLALFPDDFEPPLSHSTGQPMPGFGGNGGGMQRTPVIFVHGNTVSARFWLPARQYFLQQGYTPDELWGLGYGWDNVRYFDSNDLSIVSLQRIVDSVTDYLSEQTGRPVHQVDIIAHSLGVTVVRQWMLQTNSFHRVRNFIGVAGANQGVWTAGMDARGQNRIVGVELAPGSPWLAQLNRHGGAIGPTRYMMLYDGTGWNDALFPKPQEHSPALDGAINIAFNAEHRAWYDHLELPRVPRAMDVMLDFLASTEPPSHLGRPAAIRREGDTIRAVPHGAELFCRTGGTYPPRDATPQERIELERGVLHTCFAQHPKSRLASPMARFTAAADTRRQAELLQVEAAPAGGSFAHPQFVTLQTPHPEAFIVYTTNGSKPDIGSPLYTAPVYVPGPLTLRAAAVAPDGSMSRVLTLDFDISLEKLEAESTLRRQVEPDTPLHYQRHRLRGR